MRALVGVVLAAACVVSCGDDVQGLSIDNVEITTPEDTPVTRNLVVDADVEISIDPPQHGTATLAGTAVTYTPALDFNGTDTIVVTGHRGAVSASATITIDVRAVDDVPVGKADSFAATEDTPLVLTHAQLLANDTDVDGDTLMVANVANATHGTIVLDSTTVTFTPTNNFSGAASFDYTVTDGAMAMVVTVTVTVGGINDAPVATDDAGTTAEDAPVSFTTLAANDTDDEGQTLTVSAVANPLHGTVVLNGATVTFTPDQDFNGAASFEYTVSDGAGTDTGTVTVTVTPVNDAPVAIGDNASTNEDTALLGFDPRTNDTDVDGPAITIDSVGNATHGTVALNNGLVDFTPDAEFHGTATFDYTITDGTLTDSATVTVTVNSVDDAPVANDDSVTVAAGAATAINHATLLANDTDIDSSPLTISAVQNADHGTVTLEATTVTFTPDVGFVGTASFEYLVDDGTLTDVGLVRVDVTSAAICGDGNIGTPETCDDGNLSDGDGCSATCAIEPGFDCNGTPSTCTPICGDNLVRGNEECDDGNAVDTDGCTTKCKKGAICDDVAVPGGDRFAVDPATGHCYVSFDDDQQTFTNAESACLGAGGYLATDTSAAEDAFIHTVQNPAQNPWIGGVDDANTTDAIFTWVTGEPFAFTHFATGQPDDDATLGGNGDCLHLLNVSSEWNDTNCNLATFVVGRICEIEPIACGDHVVEVGEECDDGNRTAGDGCNATCQTEVGCGNNTVDPGEECDDDNIKSGDGCSSTCQLELGCGNGTVDSGEECDDDNTASGDGCSSTCKLEKLATFSFTGAIGNEVTFPADGAAPAPGLNAIPLMSRGPGLTVSSAANSFSSIGFTLLPTLDANDYYSFTVTPAAGFTMTLTRLELDERRSLAGIRTWSLRSSLDAFAADIQVFNVPDDDLFRNNQLILLPAAFANLATSVEFRLFGFGAELNGGSWRLDNVELFGFTKQ